MNPLDIEILKKINQSERNLIGRKSSMFEKVVSMIKWHIVAYSLFAIGGGIYFFFTLFTRVKIATTFTVLIGLYLIFVGIVGLVAVYFDSERYNRYVSNFREIEREFTCVLMQLSFTLELFSSFFSILVLLLHPSSDHR